MLRNIVLFFSLICASHVLAKPHQAIKPARYSFSNWSSSYNIQGLPSSSGSGLTSITRTVTVVTTGIAGATITEIEFPTTIDTAGDVSTITSTLSGSGNGNGAFTTSSSNSPPDANPCSSSTHTKQHHTKTLSGANAAETMTISPGEQDVHLYVIENHSEEIEYVEVRFSTWFKSAGAGRPTNIRPDAGEQGVETTSAPTTSSSDSTNAGALRQNGSGRGKDGARAHWLL
jgi:hypothetical protein